ncbi:hypothetical protein Bca4012_032563 [Brassica carinata]
MLISLPLMERERLSFLLDKPNMAVLQRSSYRLRQACLGETWRTRYLGFSSSFSSVMYPLISKFQRVAEMAEQTTRMRGRALVTRWFLPGSSLEL